MAVPAQIVFVMEA